MISLIMMETGQLIVTIRTVQVRVIVRQQSRTAMMPLIMMVMDIVTDELLGPKGIYPNVDFYSGILYERLDIPRDLFTPIFAVSRVAGWCAHWLEQVRGNRLFRPRQIYTGERDRQYVALRQR